LLLFGGIEVNIRRAGGRVKSEEFKLVKTSMDVWSIKSLVTHEIMHNPVGPWKEANDLYIAPSALRERLGDFSYSKTEPLVLYDVGLGAGANSLAAVSMFESLSETRPFHIYSFESNLKLLQFALDCAEYFPHIEAHRQHIRGILEKGESSRGLLKWKLIEGDFNQKIFEAREPASLVFFDPYSPKTNPEMWGIETFEKVFRNWAPENQGGGLLLTYSQSTGVRSAMITAGLLVGLGPSTGLKEATTQASNKISLLHSPLEKNWYERWKSSHARYPIGCIDRRLCVDNAVKSYFLDVSP
jgi:tRNA U34 5-methylaminomethyl-2-thiouridine-forming methyltransferase MnmC